jgi:IclR family acetate operon transcriptional repressor
VRSVHRALDILDVFTPETPSVSVVEIQKKVRLSRPTVYRLLETLAAHGFIRVHGAPSRYSLDYTVGRLAQNWLAGMEPAVVGRPFAERLHDQTMETVALAIVRGHQHFYVLELVGRHVLSMSRGIGPMDHLSRGASGKAILAFLNENDRKIVLRTSPKDLDRDALLKELDFIRANKFWVARSEVFAGAVGIAAPYFDATNRVVGSMIVFGPEVRFSDERIANTTSQVVKCAEELSAAMGHAASREAQQKRGTKSRRYDN